MRRILKHIFKKKNDKNELKWYITNIPREKELLNLCLGHFYNQIDGFYLDDMVDYYEIPIKNNFLNIIQSYMKTYSLNRKIKKHNSAYKGVKIYRR